MMYSARSSWLNSFCNSLLRWTGQCVGRLVRIRLPGIFAQWSIRVFAKFTGADAGEAEREIDDYLSIGDFFVRRLKPNARPVEEGVVAPVDSLVLDAGPITDSQTFLVKGESYSLSDLLGGKDSAEFFESGHYMVCYLAPGGYHRIHSPVEGTIVRRTHIFGELWPVNSIGMRFVPQLFVRNERLVTLIEHGYGYAAVVKVGALNVGSIKTSYIDHCNEKVAEPDRSTTVQDLVLQNPVAIGRGQEIGYFEMGSTVVLLISGEEFRANDRWCQGVLRMGQSVGGFQLDE